MEIINIKNFFIYLWVQKFYKTALLKQAAFLENKKTANKT